MKNEVKYERDYIQYLIENKKSIDTVLLDRYFLNEIEFQELINTVELDDILSFQSFVKSKKIDSLLG
jgi:thymidylate kinase